MKLNYHLLSLAFFSGCVLTNFALASNICDARMHPQHLEASYSFNGFISSDGMHSTLILLPNCNGKGFPMLPDSTSTTSAGEGPSTLIRQAIMNVGMPGTVDKSIVVDVDAVIIKLDNGILAVRIKKLNKLTLNYPKAAN